ncbi:MAG: hypothetical protein EXS63_06400 [Candidatus Omnitrophica bacterium]|nr:hypothetical protein [Candidatus Omnitrophota bacterium]
MENQLFNLFTAHRREFIARAMIDIVKLCTGAFFVSDFFARYPSGIRIVISGMMVIVFVVAWILFPPKGAK